VSRAVRIYPRRGEGGRTTLIGDVVVVLLIVLFAWVGIKLHDSISGLGDMAKGIEDTGTSIRETGQLTGDEIRRGFGSAADAVGAAPFVGGQLADTLRSTGDRSANAVVAQARRSGQELQAAGRQGRRDAESTARLVGWLAFLVPTVLLLSQALPTRLRQVRSLRAP
jgi:hypothetical protein